MPLLRQLLPGSPSRRHGSRGELRAEMISAPLRDFRHTMHVGRGGAAFGDTAFLSGGTTTTATAATATTSSPPTPPPASRRPSPHNLLLLLPWGRVRRSNSGQQQQQLQQQQQGGQLGEIPPAGQSPIIKNALSLPALTGPRFTLGSSGSRSATATPVRVTPAAGGQARGPPKEDEEEDGDEEEEEVDGPGGLGSPSARRRAAFPHTDSVLSFHVDLGPSMLGDVLGVMDVVDEAQGGAGPARSSVLEPPPPPPPHGAEDLADGDDVDDGDGDVDGVLDGAETRGAAERAGPKGGQSRLGGSHEGGQERAVAAPGEAVSVGAVAGAGQEKLQGAAEKVDTENGERAAERAGDGSSEGAVARQDVREGAGQEETLEGAGQETRDGARLGALGSEGQESSQGAAGRAGQG